MLQQRESEHTPDSLKILPVFRHFAGFHSDLNEDKTDKCPANFICKTAGTQQAGLSNGLSYWVNCLHM